MMVCVCNATYCDYFRLPERVVGNKVLVYTSSQSGLRFSKSEHTFINYGGPQHDNDGSVVLTIDSRKKYQSILGFGGAITDAVVLNYYNMTGPTKSAFLRSYYSELGINYNMIRIPMASCDFSTHVYSYDDHDNDFNLTHFELTVEDTHHKIAMIHEILNLTREDIKVYASPWSAPGWMKSTDSMIGGPLINEPNYFKTWANYFVKFLKAYESYGIKIWGITAQNEPEDGYNTKYPFQSMHFTPETGADFVLNYLCPLLKSNGFLPELAVMILDDNRPFIRKWADQILGKLNGSTECVKGIALHWYLNFISPKIQSLVHLDYPNYFILSSEACTGSLPWENNVKLGDWSRGEKYGRDIMQGLTNWLSGWTDWNIMLNLNGGPNWVGNFVDSPVIFNVAKDEFYKQPMFYFLGHFSKFIPRGSVRIDVEMSNNTKSKFLAIAFETDHNYSIVILNTHNEAVNCKVVNADKSVDLTLEGRSIKSIIWPKLEKEYSQIRYNSIN
ncbi:lysosomal acid glucosylceramidase-like [Gordionus sp. m RMFG-2023]|uniref:lysosomal acid glucosylceramidase-like n=1 Tax=Gordionus sp. m RMFG-2023 TaxID=3053472 RepID=UPI0031FC7D92